MDIKELMTTASLARLELDESEAEKLGNEISLMLEYFEKMSQVNVDGLEPTTHAFQKENRIRPDRLASPHSTDAHIQNNNQFNYNQLLENGNDVEDNFFVIPNVL